MFRFRRPVHLLVLVATLASLVASVPLVSAEPIATDPFERTWQRTDKPVRDGGLQRTWMWGPEPFTTAKTEDYAEAPGGTRTVQYFDKSRMEDNSYRGEAPWDVTNGLLVVEMMTGNMQLGDGEFEQRKPARINVAGDPGDPLTYAVLAGVRGNAPQPTGTTITQRINASGQVSDDPALASYGVTAVEWVEASNHTVASPFWNFMNASGTVYENGGTTNDKLFENAFYATGLPITEAYWADITLGGQQRELLLQCFERRCLTYTPGNPVEWQVEAGNVGQHYYRWRYPDATPGPDVKANELATAITNADSDESREAALLDVMDALGVGVYTANGAQIVGGAERGATDFYLYELEIELMAKALGRAQAAGTSPELAAAGLEGGDLLTVEDLAMTLTNLPILEGGATVDAELLRQVIIEGAQAAQAKPGESSSLGPLVARELGLSHEQPYDMFTNVPIEQLRFDPLQTFLILSDILLPIVAEAGPVEVGGTQIVAQSQGILSMAKEVHPCEDAVGTGVKEGWSGGKWALGFVKKIGNPMKIAAVAIDGIHGSVLAYSVLVYSLDQKLETHYGHETAGQALHFRVKVEMVDELPENVVKCGWLLGVEFPKKGPIKDVAVAWSRPQLEQHGTVICTETCVKTAPDGIATLIFQPKNEAIPGEGWVVEEQGVVTGYAMYQSRHKNVLGSINQVITPKSGATRWVVERHEQPGWNVEMTVEYDVDSSWKHIGYDAADDYFAETADGSGEMTFTLNIPMEALDTEGDYSVMVDANGNATVHQVSTDHSRWSAYEHWEYDCSATFQSAWETFFTMTEIYTDTTGGRTVLSKMMMPTYMAMDKWNVSGWSNWGDNCEAMVKGDSTVLGSILKTVPSFSLDKLGEQTFDGDASAICSSIRETLLMKWGDTPNQPGVQQSCSVDAEWTIKVEWAQQPGS